MNSVYIQTNKKPMKNLENQENLDREKTNYNEKSKMKNSYPLNVAILGIRFLTRTLQSTPFYNPEGLP